MIDPQLYKEIYEKLDGVSPDPFDCGKICGSACCHSDDSEYGLYLLPGEENLHEDSDWNSMERTEYGMFVQCKGPGNCDRSRRPMQCRTFPLMPVINDDGEIQVEINDIETAYSCPLIDSDTELEESFVAATKEAWTELAGDAEIREFIRSFM